MTNHQYIFMKKVVRSTVTTTHLTEISNVTVGSCVVRGWIYIRDNTVLPTDAGFEAFNAYDKGGLNLRKHVGDVTDRVKNLLHIHKIIEIREIKESRKAG